MTCQYASSGCNSPESECLGLCMQSSNPQAQAGVAQRITDYLASGGLFNPELASHDAVRDLLIDCREAIAKKDAALKACVAALQGFMENVDTPPDGNCSCHISPPCSDCVNYSCLREAFTNGREAITQVWGALK